MIDFLPFALALAGFLLLGAVACAWTFRRSSAPMGWRIALPALMLAAALYAPFAAISMFGRPVMVRLAAMPGSICIIAFQAHDDRGLVDLWLVGASAPRAYEVVLDQGMKDALRAAAPAIARGLVPCMHKPPPPSHGGGHGLGDPPPYVLSDDAISRLPPKRP